MTDHCGIDPCLGTPGDFQAFLGRARERGMRVLIDLIINHISAVPTRCSSPTRT